MNTFTSFDRAFRSICQDVGCEYDFVCSPRGQKVREKLGYTFTLEDPRKRLINNPIRDAKYGFGVGEFLWYLQGREDLEMMQYYNKRTKGFSNDGKTVNSAYGNRIFRPKVTVGSVITSQWQTAIEELRKDPDSRRALLLINVKEDEALAAWDTSKDVPCTLALQFFIRENRLYMHTTMRSNDVFWGLTYDLFSFTLIQECMMMALRVFYPNLELGSYSHTAGSIHIYERHFEQAEQIARQYKLDWDPNAPGMEPLTSFDSLMELCRDEELLRTGKIQSVDLGKYRGGELWMAVQLNAHRQKRDEENGK